jgi:hypothetical protein
MHTRRIIDAPLSIKANRRDGDICNATAAADDACKYDGATKQHRCESLSEDLK